MSSISKAELMKSIRAVLRHVKSMPSYTSSSSSSTRRETSSLYGSMLHNIRKGMTATNKGEIQSLRFALSSYVELVKR
jgi:hypothetical protein